jgi:hypothetical protein
VKGYEKRNRKKIATNLSFCPVPWRRQLAHVPANPRRWPRAVTTTERNTSRRRSSYVDEQSRHHPGHQSAIPAWFYGGGPLSYRGHSSGGGGVFSRYGLAREDNRGKERVTGRPFIPRGPGSERGKDLPRPGHGGDIYARRCERVGRANVWNPLSSEHGTRAELSYRPGGPTIPPKPARIPAASRGRLLA